MRTKEQTKKLEEKHKEFLTKCENLARQFVTIPAGAESDRPLNKAYENFESVMSSFQEKIKERR